MRSKESTSLRLAAIDPARMEQAIAHAEIIAESWPTDLRAGMRIVRSGFKKWRG